jgi:hypothetical protein
MPAVFCGAAIRWGLGLHAAAWRSSPATITTTTCARVLVRHVSVRLLGGLRRLLSLLLHGSLLDLLP